MPSVMYQTILFKAPGRRSNSPVVILNALSLRQSLTLGPRLSRALSSAWNWVKCNCTPRNIVRVAFGEKVSMAVGAIVVCAMWWHIISIDDTIAGGEAVATDCLYAMPWGIVWAIRATLMTLPKEGGEL